MNYCISYRNPRRRTYSRLKYLRLHVLTLICFLLFLFMVNIMWHEGMDCLRNITLTLREKTSVVLNHIETGLLYKKPLSAVFSDILHSP